MEGIDLMDVADNPDPERLLAAARLSDRDALGQLLELYHAYLTFFWPGWKSTAACRAKPIRWT
jgi:hypothetical protein